MLAALDVTNVLDTLIITIPAIIAALYAGRIHHQIKTPSGKTIGAVAEYSHDTAIANNMLLSRHNGPTKSIDRETIESEGATPPRMPVEPPPPKQD